MSLRKVSYIVHTYTSPHLIEFNERINLAGKNISDYHLLELLEKVRIKAEKLNLEPSFFDWTLDKILLQEKQ